MIDTTRSMLVKYVKYTVHTLIQAKIEWCCHTNTQNTVKYNDLKAENNLRNS